MNVLITLDFPPELGGIQRYLDTIVRHTFRRGDVVLVGAHSIEAPEQRSDGTRIEYVAHAFSSTNKKWSLIPLIFKFLWLRLAHENLTVYCGNAYAGIAVWLVSKIRPVKYKVYVYGTELSRLSHKGFVGKILRKVFTHAEALLVLGDYTRSLVVKSGIPTPMIDVPPRIDVRDKTRRMVAKHTVHKGDIIKLLSVGRLVHHKGHHVLVNALSRLAYQTPFSCTFVGEGPRHHDLSLMCQRTAITPLVTFKHRLSESELSVEYRTASIFVFPSLETKEGTEGFGIALLEAMSWGLPIIASAAGGIPDVVGDAALLVEPGSDSALATAIRKLVTSPELCEELSRKARERVYGSYVWP